MENASPLLRLSEVSKSFGSHRVIPPLSLELETGELLGVIGPNGAGKTTLFSLISGYLKTDGGNVLLDGRDISSLAANERCRAGIARTFQVPRPFAGLTVLENVLVGARFGTDAGHDATGRAIHALECAGLLDRANQAADTLTLLQRKQLELARAVATQPRVLLLDEIAGGLTDSEVHRVIDLIQSLLQTGITIVWIEHLVHALSAAARRLVVLNFGEVVADGAPKKVLADPLVRSIYMGIEVDEPAFHA